MKAKIVLVAFLLFLFCFSFAKQVFAVTTSITEYPQSISSEPFNIKVLITGAGSGQNYLRVDIFKEGTTNYFGETYNNLIWYSGSDGKQHFPVTIDSSSVSASLQGRIGSPSTTEFPGAGSYKLKIRRYTSSGNPASSDEQTPVNIQINFSIPTPSPTFTPSPSPTKTPTPTKSPAPTKSPTPTKTPTPTKFPTPASNSANATSKPSTPAPSILLDNGSFEEGVLGEASESATMSALNNPSAQKNPERKEIVLSSRENNIAKILIALGFVFILACGILFSWPHIKKKLKKNE